MPIGTVQWKYYKAVKSLKISLGNLMASLLVFITFVLTQKTKKQNSIKEDESITTKEEEKTNVQEEAQESTKKENDVQSKIESDMLENITQNAKEEQSEDNMLQMPQEEIQNCTQINHAYLLGISAMFLIISISFFIIFQKHQQKRKNKTSKEKKGKR